MIGINLIPDTVQRTRKWKRHLAVWAVLNLSVAVLLILPLVIGWVRQGEANELAKENDLLQSELGATRAKLRRLKSSAEDALLCLERAKALRSKREWSSIVASIAERLPAGSWLTSIASDPFVPPPASTRADAARLAERSRGTTESPPGAVTIDAPRSLLLTGYATDASEPYQFVMNLRNAGMFGDIAMLTSRREPALNGSYFRFELNCDW